MLVAKVAVSCLGGERRGSRVSLEGMSHAAVVMRPSVDTAPFVLAPKAMLHPLHPRPGNSLTVIELLLLWNMISSPASFFFVDP